MAPFLMPERERANARSPPKPTKIAPKRKIELLLNVRVKNKFPISENFMQKPIDKRKRKVYNDTNVIKNAARPLRQSKKGVQYGTEDQKAVPRTPRSF